MGLSLAQQRTLAIMPKVTGLLSLLCSTIVVHSVLRSPKKRARIYHRLMLCISLLDMCNSFWLILSTWPIPSDSGLVYAVGNQTTCITQGFFIQCSIAAPLLNGSLAVYYLLVLKYEWKEKHIKKYERLMYSLPLIWALGTATISIPLRLFNNASLWCWIAPFPAGCEDDDCIRGANASNFRWAFFYGPLWIMILLVTYSQLSVLIHLRKAMYSFVRKEPTPDDVSGEILAQDKEETKAMVNMDKVAAELRQRRTNELATQCFLYAGSFYLQWCAVTLRRE